MAAPPRVRVVANGRPVELAAGATVEHLVARLDAGARWIVVERNGEPVAREERATTVLADGDRLEVVRAVAGG
ncbi:MAG: sulfur carrier protein ThiS [Acidimicrobiales bacterium]